MMILILLSVGCQNSSVISDFCFIVEPITITANELNLLSEETLRQIDNFNQEYVTQCD